MLKTLLNALLLILSLPLFPQKMTSQQFSMPLKIPILLAGNFGELRSNHFHSGIDIKTQQREGLKVYAIDDGYVYRIKISPWGFGKAIYIKHDSGHTSVYAHLKKLNSKIEKIIKKWQYDHQSYNTDIEFSENEIPISKDEVIAYSGNTGSSAGPHLHFEIRDSQSQDPLNPQNLNFKIDDNIPPVVSKLYGYAISEDAVINHHNDLTNISFNQIEPHVFLAQKIHAYGDIGFGIVGFDRQDKTHNKNGIYKVTVKVNGSVVNTFQFDRFSFEKSKYINTMIDYPHFKKNKQRILKCFVPDGNLLDIYQNTIDKGLLKVEQGLSYTVEILLSDIYENTTKLIIPIDGKRISSKYPKKEKKGKFIRRDRDHIFPFDNFSVYFPKNTFFEDLYIQIEQIDKNTIKIFNHHHPLKKSYRIVYKPHDLNKNSIQQYFIAQKKGKYLSYITTRFKKNKLVAFTKTMGVFSISKDTIPPSIKPLNFRNEQWVSKYQYLKIKITDNKSGLKKYTASINGKWILLEYEPKKATFTYDFSDLKFDTTKLNLVIKALDHSENESTYTTTIFRKSK